MRIRDHRIAIVIKARVMRLKRDREVRRKLRFVQQRWARAWILWRVARSFHPSKTTTTLGGLLFADFVKGGLCGQEAGWVQMVLRWNGRRAGPSGGGGVFGSVHSADGWDTWSGGKFTIVGLTALPVGATLFADTGFGDECHIG